MTTASRRKKKPFSATPFKTAIHRSPARRAGRAARRNRPVVAVGDVHGDYDGFTELLLHAGLIDGRARWCGGSTTLVQMGDVVDRGPKPFEVQTLLDRLQREAPQSGGTVIRLIGNHEMELLKGNYAITTLPDSKIEKFTAELKDGVLEGKLQAAYSRHGYLFTHAGATADLQTLFAEYGATDEDSLASEMNAVFINAAATNDFSHPIFNVGSTRGGPHRFGGIFWEDIEDLFYSDNPLHIRQVVGHTPLREVSVSDDGKIIAVDIGIYVGYGGGRGYLKIRSGKPEIVNIRPAK